MAKDKEVDFKKEEIKGKEQIFLETLNQNVNTFKEYLEDFKKKKNNKSYSLSEIESLTENFIKDLKNPESLCLGAPLANILTKA